MNVERSCLVMRALFFLFCSVPHMHHVAAELGAVPKRARVNSCEKLADARCRWPFQLRVGCAGNARARACNCVVARAPSGGRRFWSEVEDMSLCTWL